MAEESALQQAQQAAKAREYERALELFNQAVDADPTAEALAGRAQVNNKLGNHIEAASDASRAVELDDSLAMAHKEKGHAYYSLEEFESAMDAFEAASKLEPSKNIHKQWVNMCKVQLGEELPPPPTRAFEPPASAHQDEHPSGSGSAGGSGSGSGGGISLSGDQLKAFLAQARAGGLASALGGAGGAPPPGAQRQEEEVGTAQPKHVTVDDPEFSKYWKAPIAASVAASIPDKPAGSKYRHQWFQSPDRVEVDVLAKGLKAEQVSVTIESDRLRVATSNAEGQQEYELDLQLHAPVDPAASRFEVLGSKIEVKLKKADPGRQWAALERGTAGQATAAPSAAAPVAAEPAAPVAAAGEPSGAAATAKPSAVYPYAGKRVDWDKLAEDLKNEEKEEKLEGDAALMKFFRELYDGGDEDTRRAMVKSMQESGGTALSMNWGEVGAKDYSKVGKEGDKVDDEEWGKRRR